MSNKKPFVLPLLLAKLSEDETILSDPGTNLNQELKRKLMDAYNKMQQAKTESTEGLNYSPG